MVNTTSKTLDQVVFTIIQCDKATLDNIIWHNRLVHPHFRMLQNVLLDIDKTCSHNCDTNLCGACKLGKLYRLSSTHKHERSR